VSPSVALKRQHKKKTGRLAAISKKQRMNNLPGTMKKNHRPMERVKRLLMPDERNTAAGGQTRQRSIRTRRSLKKGCHASGIIFCAVSVRP